MKNIKTLKNDAMMVKKLNRGNRSVGFSELYLCNVMVSLANHTYLLLRGGEGWGKFETLMKSLYVKCSTILHEKILC